MVKVSLFILASFLLILPSLIILCGVDAQTTIENEVWVEGGGSYSTIREAVRNAPAGSTVVVGSGTYRESIYIDVNITLKSQIPGAAIIDANELGSCITIETGFCRIEGMRCINSQETYRYYGGIYYYGGIRDLAGNTTIINCFFEDNENGILIDVASNTTVEGSTFNENVYGIKVYGNDNDLLNNTYTSCNTGIDINHNKAWKDGRSFGSNKVFGCHFMGGHKGISSSGHGNMIEQNQVSCDFGIDISGWDNTASNNTIDSLQYDGFGISVIGSGHMVSSNSVEGGNGTGIKMMGGSDTIIEKNSVVANRIGISVKGDARAYIRENSLLNNRDIGIALGEEIGYYGTPDPSSNSSIVSNDITGSPCAMKIVSPTGHRIEGNKMIGGDVRIIMEEDNHLSTLEFDDDNTIDGKPLTVIKDLKGSVTEGDVPGEIIYREGSLIEGGTFGEIILFNCEDIRLTDIEMTSGPGSIKLFGCSRVRVDNCTIRGVDIGIELQGSSDCIVVDNHIKDCGTGTVIGSKYLTNNQYNTVGYSTFENCTVGSIVSDSTGTMLFENSYTCINMKGIHNDESRSTLIWGCTFTSIPIYGVWDHSSHMTAIEQCEFSGIGRAAVEMDHSYECYVNDSTIVNCHDGIILTTSDRCFITGNEIKECAEDAIVLNRSSEDNTIKENILKENEGYGLSMHPGILYYHTRNNLIAWNQFIDNNGEVGQALVSSNSENTWYEDGRGNYWSDHEIRDTDGDGICDTPYTIYSTSYGSEEDPYPLTLGNDPMAGKTDEQFYTEFVLKVIGLIFILILVVYLMIVIIVKMSKRRSKEKIQVQDDRVLRNPPAHQVPVNSQFQKTMQVSQADNGIVSNSSTGPANPVPAPIPRQSKVADIRIPEPPKPPEGL